jgi:hypothetical protein
VADIEVTYTLSDPYCSMSHIRGYPLQGRMGYGVGWAISLGYVGRAIDVVGGPPGRGLVGLGPLLYILGVGVGMVVVLGALWLVGRRFDPIAHWFGPRKRRFQRRVGWSWRR